MAQGLNCEPGPGPRSNGRLRQRHLDHRRPLQRAAPGQEQGVPHSLQRSQLARGRAAGDQAAEIRLHLPVRHRGGEHEQRLGRSNRLSDRVPLGLAALERQPLAVDIAAGHTRPTAAGNAGRQRGVWAIMFQSVTGEYKFAHYSGGRWTFHAAPTAGLPPFGSSATVDVYALSRIPGTRSMLGTGDVFIYGAKNVNRQYSLIFRYGP